MECEYRRITNDMEAEAAVKEIIAAEAEKARLLSIVEGERVMLDTKEMRIRTEFEDKVNFQKNLLRDYMSRVEAKETKTQKTYRLLSGKLIVKKPYVRVKRDDAVIAEWARENAPEFLRSTESVLWGDLKPFLSVVGENVIYKETGEIIGGLAIEETEEEFDVR